ncbi:MAG: signal recognition particle-docking protein FtsY [Sphaerochaetaceae bacterium]|nr:signal recognition particle-docking protein FtsY [Sphaerochaetaceae bacterium]
MKKLGFGAKLASLFGFRKEISEEFYEDLEDTLIEGDFGSVNAMAVSDAVRAAKPKTKDDFHKLVYDSLKDKIQGFDFDPDPNRISLVLVLGVNGVGKTTTIAKLAAYYKDRGFKPLLVAGDTFRAGAIDQLEIHSQRLGVRLVKQSSGSDPGAVVFDAIASARAKGENLILCDTAGRMHNKENLVNELKKIDKIISAKLSDGLCTRFLTIDSTTGQNSISQATLFGQAVHIDALLLTKTDSLSKAGALFQIGLPIAFTTSGESYKDIEKFNKDSFIEAILGQN